MQNQMTLKKVFLSPKDAKFIVNNEGQFGSPTIIDRKVVIDHRDDYLRASIRFTLCVQEYAGVSGDITLTKCMKDRSPMSPMTIQESQRIVKQVVLDYKTTNRQLKKWLQDPSQGGNLFVREECKALIDAVTKQVPGVAFPTTDLDFVVGLVVQQILARSDFDAKTYFPDSEELKQVIIETVRAVFEPRKVGAIALKTSLELSVHRTQAELPSLERVFALQKLIGSLIENPPPGIIAEGEKKEGSDLSIIRRLASFVSDVYWAMERALSKFELSTEQKDRFLSFLLIPKVLHLLPNPLEEEKFDNLLKALVDIAIKVDTMLRQLNLAIQTNEESFEDYQAAFSDIVLFAHHCSTEHFAEVPLFVDYLVKVIHVHIASLRTFNQLAPTVGQLVSQGMHADLFHQWRAFYRTIPQVHWSKLPVEANPHWQFQRACKEKFGRKSEVPVALSRKFAPIRELQIKQLIHIEETLGREAMLQMETLYVEIEDARNKFDENCQYSSVVAENASFTLGRNHIFDEETVAENLNVLRRLHSSQACAQRLKKHIEKALRGASLNSMVKITRNAIRNINILRAKVLYSFGLAEPVSSLEEMNPEGFEMKLLPGIQQNIVENLVQLALAVKKLPLYKDKEQQTCIDEINRLQRGFMEMASQNTRLADNSPIREVAQCLGNICREAITKAQSE